MAILTFPWDDVGACSGIVPGDRCFSIHDEYTGYKASRPTATRKVKAFKVTHRLMNTQQWLALIEFWRLVGDHDAFYWEFPIELYGVAGYGGDNLGEEDPGGWDTEGDGMGFGAGPVFLVQFEGKILWQTHVKPFYWGVSYQVIEV